MILAGDTHGGQIRIPVIGDWLLKKLFNMKYISGEYNIDDTVLYVNRGIGTSGLPFRFNCRPEVTLINLIPK